MPFNKSAFGVYDMAGNVWEWVEDPTLRCRTATKSCEEAVTDFSRI